MARISLWLPLSGFTAVLFTASTARAETPAAEDFFEKEVRPLLVEHCQKCHGDKKSKGGLRLTSRDGVLKVGERRPATDLPIAGLLYDLKARGLMDDTIVLWGAEFGRTPTAEGTDGREHHPFGFTMWLAGAGIKGGIVHGATDEFGWHAVENKVQVRDLHATLLHMMGLNHERLTYRHAGRDYRLTDVHGSIVKGILAS